MICENSDNQLQINVRGGQCVSDYGASERPQSKTYKDKGMVRTQSFVWVEWVSCITCIIFVWWVGVVGTSLIPTEDFLGIRYALDTPKMPNLLGIGYKFIVY